MQVYIESSSSPFLFKGFEGQRRVCERLKEHAWSSGKCNRSQLAVCIAVIAHNCMIAHAEMQPHRHCLIAFKRTFLNLVL